LGGVGGVVRRQVRAKHFRVEVPRDLEAENARAGAR
jgi:hypothetical protein